VVARLLRAELPSEPLGIEERPQTRDNGALVRGIPVSSQLGVGSCEHWTRHHLDGAAGVTGEDALLLERGEFDGHYADGAADDVSLHGEDVPELGVVAFGPDMGPRRGLRQSGGHANVVARAADAAVEEVARIEQPTDFGRWAGP
jgi:hypothetical protein